MTMREIDEGDIFFKKNVLQIKTCYFYPKIKQQYAI